MGKIGKTHGVKGWVKLISFTSPIENLANYSRFTANRHSTSTVLEIDEIKHQSAGLVAHVKGYDTPEAAKQLTGYTLHVDVDQLPPLTNDEVYWYQLEGLNVFNQHQQHLGVVEKMLETGANDVIVVGACKASIDDRERLIPYRYGATVTSIDLENGKIQVQWDADYLE